MSMLCSVYRLTAGQAARLRAAPEAVGELLGYSRPVPKVGLLSKLFGKAQKEVPLPERTFDPVEEDDTFDLDQTWHIVHYLLCGGNAEGQLPAAFIISGGEEIGEDLGYGPPRLFLPKLSQEIAALLDTQSFEALDAAYVQQDIEAAQIYWQASSEPAERRRQVEEIWAVVEELRTFFQQVARTGSASLVHIY